MGMKMRYAGLLALGATLMVGCPIRTEHKIETTHKIEAHIVIDVRKVQEQAAQIEDEVRVGSEVPKASPDPGSKTGAMAARSELNHLLAAPPRGIWSIFDLSTRAAAAETEESAAIARRKARAAQINAALTQGCLGENNQGNVEIRPCPASEDAAQKAGFQVFAEDENRDRKIIYAAIAVREGAGPEQAGAIGEIFAAEIRKRLTSGQAFQAPTDDQQYEEFAKSELGRTLGSPKPGAWVVMP